MVVWSRLVVPGGNWWRASSNGGTGGAGGHGRHGWCRWARVARAVPVVRGGIGGTGGAGGLGGFCAEGGTGNRVARAATAVLVFNDWRCRWLVVQRAMAGAVIWRKWRPGGTNGSIRFPGRPAWRWLRIGRPAPRPVTIGRTGFQCDRLPVEPGRSGAGGGAGGDRCVGGGATARLPIHLARPSRTVRRLVNSGGSGVIDAGGAVGAGLVSVGSWVASVASVALVALVALVVFGGAR